MVCSQWRALTEITYLLNEEEYFNNHIVTWFFYCSFHLTHFCCIASYLQCNSKFLIFWSIELFSIFIVIIIILLHWLKIINRHNSLTGNIICQTAFYVGTSGKRVANLQQMSWYLLNFALLSQRGNQISQGNSNNV